MPHNRWVWLSPFWRPQGCLILKITCGKFSTHHWIFRIRASRLLKEISRECCKFKSPELFEQGCRQVPCLPATNPLVLFTQWFQRHSYFISPWVSAEDSSHNYIRFSLREIQEDPTGKGTNSGEYGFHGPARRWELSRYLLQNTQLKVCCVFDK